MPYTTVVKYESLITRMVSEVAQAEGKEAVAELVIALERALAFATEIAQEK